MEVKNIVDKILEDAKLESENVLRTAKKICQNKTKEVDEIIKNELDLTTQTLKETKRELTKNFKSRLVLEKKKIETQFNRTLLKSFKSYLYDYFLAMNAKTKLSFVNSILKKEAGRGDTVYVLLKNVSTSQIENLKIVKDLKLKIKEGETQGLIISSKKYDATFLISDLLGDYVDNHEWEILDQILNDKDI